VDKPIPSKLTKNRGKPVLPSFPSQVKVNAKKEQDHSKQERLTGIRGMFTQNRERSARNTDAVYGTVTTDA